MASSSQSRHRSGRGVRCTTDEIIELLFHYTQTIYQYPCESGLTDRYQKRSPDRCNPPSKSCTHRPRNFRLEQGWGHAANHIFPHLFAQRYTKTRFALTLSDTPGVRACMVREDFRIERAAAGALTLAVSDGVTRARIIMRMTRAVTGVDRPLDIVSRARFIPSG